MFTDIDKSLSQNNYSIRNVIKFISLFILYVFLYLCSYLHIYIYRKCIKIHSLTVRLAGNFM